MTEGKQSFRKGSINAEGAIIVQGIEAKVKASAVFTQFHIPPALFPLATIEEFGHNDQSRIFWMKQKATTSTEFAHAEMIAMYSTTISGQLEKNKIKNLKGVKFKEMKGRELYLSVPYDEVFVDDDEIRLRSKTHTTRNCMLVSFSDHPPPPRGTPSPEQLQAAATASAPSAEDGDAAPAEPVAADTKAEDGEAAEPEDSEPQGEGEGDSEEKGG